MIELEPKRMSSRLDLLFVSPYPASPASFGAQRRVEGLMRALGRRHDVSFVGLVSADFDRALAERAMRAYCREVVLVPWEEATGRAKRLEQVRSLASRASQERRTMNGPALQRALERVLTARRFDLVCIESPFMAFSRLRISPTGAKAPKVVVDSHNVEFDLARQYAAKSKSVGRRLFHSINWRKLRTEEIDAWGRVDGVAFTSPDDDARAQALLPGVRSAVIPNGVDMEYFRTGPDLPAPDGRTVMFFGTMNYFPNVDAVRWLLREIWPAVARRHPDARLKIVGSHPLPDVIAASSPRIEIVGYVDDIRTHLAEAAAIIVPLRIGGGTRLKILESLAMEKAVVSTTLGAEGIGAIPGEHLLIADDPRGLIDGVLRLLGDPAVGERLGTNGRNLIEGRYSWAAIGSEMEAFVASIVGGAEGPLAGTGT